MRTNGGMIDSAVSWGAISRIRATGVAADVVAAWRISDSAKNRHTQT
jgi:hypothetical protein